MAEYIDQTPLAAMLFTVVFTLNVMLAFAPPLSFVGFSIPTLPVGALALPGATAATPRTRDPCQALPIDHSWKNFGQTYAQEHKRNQRWVGETPRCHFRDVSGVRLQSVAVELSIHSLWSHYT